MIFLGLTDEQKGAEVARYCAEHMIALARIPRPHEPEDARAASREAVGAGWGGPSALLGSPAGGSVLPIDEVLRLVRANVAWPENPIVPYVEA